MSTALLNEAYDSELFRDEGHELIDLLSDHLKQTVNGRSDKVINWSEPKDEFAFWENYAKEKHPTKELFTEILQRSIHTHHPKYIGHQVTPTVPISSLATLMSALLNNGSGVYEMGAAGNAIEKLVIKMFTDALGYDDNADGFLTSGGTLANLTALISARGIKAKHDIWHDGHGDKLAVMISGEAHYCVDRAARIMGLGDQGILKVPVDEGFAMKTELLQEHFDKATNNGFQVIAVVGSAPSTSTGAYENLTAIGNFAQKNNIWFHVDAAHGGAAIFSDKYKHLLSGVEKADSVVIDGHKMMMTSALATALVFKRSADSYATFSQKAQYLWEKNDDLEWYNLAKRTFECTKSMMSIRFFAIMNRYGTQLFNDYVTTLYDLGHEFGKIVTDHPDFELAISPVSNIVCFRYNRDPDVSQLNRINQKIRRQTLEEGKFYIVATQLNEDYYLRVTIMNPFTTVSHLKELLNHILDIASSNEM